MNFMKKYLYKRQITQYNNTRSKRQRHSHLHHASCSGSFTAQENARKEFIMRKKNAAPTMKDVALGTVSKVINGLPVGESYRLRVEDAIRKLDYHVNSYAQGLKASKTYTVALLIPNTSNPFFAQLVYHINTALLKRKYRQEYIMITKQNKVDGIIGLTYNPNLHIEEHIPFVSIDRPMGTHIPCVASDNFAGGQMAVEKLADLGCKNVAFLRVGSSLDSEPNKRKAGFENGCLARELTYDAKILKEGEPISEFEAFFKEHMTDGKLHYCTAGSGYRRNVRRAPASGKHVHQASSRLSPCLLCIRRHHAGECIK